MLQKTGQFLRHPLFLCLVSFSLCFVLGLLLFLPLEPLTRQIEGLAQKHGLKLHLESPGISFPLVITAENITISHPEIPQRPIRLKELRIQPLWSSLVSDNPGLHFTLEGYQGQIKGSAMRNGQVSVAFNGLIFNESLEPQYPLNLSGRIDSANFSGVLPLQGNNRSQLQIDMSDLNLSGLQNFGSSNDVLSIGQLQCRARITGPLITLGTLKSAGSDLLLNGNGTLRLGHNPASSSLNLNLNITPQESFDPLLKDMLSLVKKPRNNGSYHLRIAGALSKIKLN